VFHGLLLDHRYKAVGPSRARGRLFANVRERTLCIRAWDHRRRYASVISGVSYRRILVTEGVRRQLELAI
jgi:hypothetical protein